MRTLCFLWIFFLHIHCFDTSARDLFGSARKNWPVASICWGCSLKIFGKRSSQHVTVSYLPGLPASPLITLSSLRVSKLFTRSFDFFLHNTCPVTGMFWFLAFGTYVASSIFCVCDALALLESAFFLILVCAVFVWYLEILIFQFSWLKRTVWICRDLPLESSFSAIMLAR